MASVNRVILIGNLGQDPEVKTLANGNKLATLSLAVNKRWKDKTTGEKREKVAWIRVQVYAKGSVEFAEKYLKKGMSVYAEGELDVREYEKDGEKRWATEVLISAFNGQLLSLEKIAGGGARPPEPSDSDYEDTPY
jgi:single-strand DNA-binding protein